MRHRNAHRKLGRTKTHRRSMLANMACSLIEHEQVKTTLPKAKELRPYVEKLVTLARSGDLGRRAAIDAHQLDEAALEARLAGIEDGEKRRAEREKARAEAKKKTLDALASHLKDVAGAAPSGEALEQALIDARRADLHARRLLEAKIKQKPAVEKLMRVLAHRYADRPGGYVRILKAGFRYGDMAPMAIVEFVDRDEEARGRIDRERVAAEEAAA